VLPAPAPAPVIASVNPAWVPAAPVGLATPASGWRVEYADAFGSCFTAASTSCSAGYLRLDSTLAPKTHANGAGNANEIAAFEPAYNDVTSQGLDEQCRAVPNLGDSYSCGSMVGTSSGAFHWNPGPSTDVVFQFTAKLPVNEGNMDPGVWATGQGYAWEIDFPEWWGWNHYPAAGAGNSWCGFLFGDPAVPQDQGGATGTGSGGTFCSGVANFDPSAGFHTWTFAEDGDTFSTYVDGELLNSRAFSGFNGAAGQLIFQNDMRQDSQGGGRTDSHFPAGGNDLIIRYIAVYEPTSANGSGTNGPVIAPGTSIQ
jgi:hypothetical protein